MSKLKYKVGDRVRIKSLGWYNKNKDNYGAIYAGSGFCFWKNMARHCGEIMKITIVKIDPEDSNKGYYFMENSEERWTDEMIEGLAEDIITTNEQLFEPSNISLEKEMEWNLPEGYQFVDENGNVINAKKIVLEKKKKKDVNLTQEQINKMVHDSCVLFCKHCGCGIPRDTCTSLGTCKEHDEYRATIRTHLMEKKKKEYPKTFLGCCDVLGIEDLISRGVKGYKAELFDTLQKLYICRDAYWKIAGEEMGLGKPWEPDWNTSEPKYVIACTSYGIEKQWENTYCKVFAFPTEEMRDAFYENFKKEIEQCKELL